MANQYVNKLILNGVTRLDLTNLTVNPSVLLKGYTAVDATGKLITGEAVMSSGGIETVQNTTELLETTDDVVLVLNNDSDFGNGGLCVYYSQGAARSHAGIERNNGTYVYPMVASAKIPAPNAPMRELMTVIHSWVGKDNIVYKDTSTTDLTGLFGTNCQVDGDNNYHMDCSDFVSAILLGISYKQSRYVLGNSAENRPNLQLTVGEMPTSLNTEKASGGLDADELALWFANYGRLFYCGTDGNALGRTLQFGDVLFGSSESSASANYFGINHVMFVLGTAIDNGVARVIVAECDSDSTYAQEATTCHIRIYSLNNSSLFKVFARPLYKSIGMNADVAIQLANGYKYDLLWLPCTEILLDDQTQQTINRKRGELHASGLFSTTYNYIPISPGAKVVFTGIASTERGNFYARVHEYDEHLDPVKRGSTIAYNGSAVAAGATMSSSTRYIKFAIGWPASTGRKIWLSDVDNFDVSITPPSE